MSPSWMLRAAASPERFLARSFAKTVTTRSEEPREMALRVVLPLELERFLRGALAGPSRRKTTDFVPRPRAPSFSALVASDGARAHLLSLLAGAIPFGETATGDPWVYCVAEAASPASRVIATVEGPRGRPHVVCRGADVLAVLYACSLHANGQVPEDVQFALATLGGPGVAEAEAVGRAFERARLLLQLVVGSDAAVRRAARALARKPPEQLPPSAISVRRGAPGGRRAPLALGPMIDAFFRAPDDQAREAAHGQTASDDAIVAEAAAVLLAALDEPEARTRRGQASSVLAADLRRRREIARRAMRSVPASPALEAPKSTLWLTRAAIAKLDATPPPLDPLSMTSEREETLLALAELGDRSVVPSLIARAVTGDIGAVEMLGVFGDPRAVPHLEELLRRAPGKARLLEATAVRALGRIGATKAAPALRRLLRDNPMTNWRDGIERAVLVRELVSTLGALRDAEAGEDLLAVLDATSQEYRATLPIAAWALGRIAYAPALRSLERVLASPKQAITCEAVWAVGELGRHHPNAQKRAGAILEGMTGLEPGAEMTRLAALAKIRQGRAGSPRASDLRRALERALWEPGFRREDTVRRHIWALRSLRDLGELRGGQGERATRDDTFFLGHEAVRYLVTRDDLRVRRAAEKAFAAWGTPVPKTRRYYGVVVDELEREGGLDALHEALRDALGVYRHNVASRLAEIADPSSARPLAEATARLFAEPVTSTYEYDDAPLELVAFVRALAKVNRPEGNEVLLEALRTGARHVRAVVADNAPDDPRFIPELRAMLGDDHSFLRSRAERSLAALGEAMPEPKAHELPPGFMEG